MTNVARLEEYLWQAAGLGASAVMKEAPDVVMPTEAIGEGMGRLLAEFREVAEPDDGEPEPKCTCPNNKRLINYPDPDCPVHGER